MFDNLCPLLQNCEIINANGRNNSQHCCPENVGNCSVRVGGGVQTDATSPNNVGSCSASWEGYHVWCALLEELCNRIQHCWATLRWSRNKRNVESCWLKSFTGLKAYTTTPNKQQGNLRSGSVFVSRCKGRRKRECMRTAKIRPDHRLAIGCVNGRNM